MRTSIEAHPVRACGIGGEPLPAKTTRKRRRLCRAKRAQALYREALAVDRHRPDSERGRGGRRARWRVADPGGAARAEGALYHGARALEQRAGAPIIPAAHRRAAPAPAPDEESS